MLNKKMSLTMLLLKPVLIIVMLVGVFGLVCLRSNCVKLEYALGELEKKKMQVLRERKLLFAEKTSQLSFARFESTQNAQNGFIVPDRLQVVHVQELKRSLPHQVSLKQKQVALP